MEFGSVKFFKIVILSATGLLIVVPTVLSLWFGVRTVVLDKQLFEANNQIKAIQTAIAATSDLTPERVDVDSSVPEQPSASPSFEYQTMYEGLYATPVAEKREDGKVAYLTFDDGPSANTERILQVLAQHEVKATFFVTGMASERSPERLKAITDAGHKLAVHTYSHKYSEIYSSVDAYLADFAKMYEIIESATGVKTDIFRFPGGSINNYNRSIYEQIIAEMTRRGFVYFDWNVSSGDVAAGATKKAILNNVLSGNAKQKGTSVILLHDRDDMNNTVAALPEIIEGLKEQGYTFDMLESNVKQFSFAYQK